MRKLLILLVIFFILPVSGFGEENIDKPEVKYRLTITVVYNSLSPQEANKIHAAVLTQHEDACKVETVTKNISSNDPTIRSWIYMNNAD